MALIAVVEGYALYQFNNGNKAPSNCELIVNCETLLPVVAAMVAANKFQPSLYGQLHLLPP